MRTQLRIVAGSLRGRKLTCIVDPGLRPTPDMVRQALFSILGDAVPDRPFFDVFAGTGVIGLEALSRGASSATFVERDFRRLAEIGQHVEEFGVADTSTLTRADVYRWVERWIAPAEPVNVFISPPFADYEGRSQDLLLVVAELQNKVHAGSVLVLQTDRYQDFQHPPAPEQWELRQYGRNQLMIWVKPEPVKSDE